MYLVTGGAGFIGSWTVRALVARGVSVRVFDDLSTGRRDRVPEGVELVEGCLTDAAAVARACDGVTGVVHLAARISVPESWEVPERYLAVNDAGFLHVLQAAGAAGVRRVAYASSCAVYGSTAALPVHEDLPLAPESPYAATKAANEAYARAFHRDDLQTLGLRYFNVFGPGQDPRGPYGAVLPTFVSRALAGQPLTIDGDGAQGRDFVHVQDVAEANAAAVLAEQGGGVVNVGTGRMLSIAALAARVREAVPSAQIVHGPERRGDVRFSRAEVSRARELLGWEARRGFDEALDATIAWFVDGCPDGAGLDRYAVSPGGSPA